MPYDLVPGMATDSRLFRKAQVTIAKQAAALSASPLSVTTTRHASVDRLFNLNQGESLDLFRLTTPLNICVYRRPYQFGR